MLPAIGSVQAGESAGPREIMVPMRDGIALATDIYRPPAAEKGPFPVLLERTPYNKRSKALTELAPFFAAHGYLVAVQDCRGRYRSAGEFVKYVNEPRDGYDAVEWLAKMPESNGSVGMWGTSYAAHVQAGAAKLNPPHLRTAVLNMGGTSNGWLSGIRNHGAFELKQLTWAFHQIAVESKDPIVRARFANEDLFAWIGAMPLRRGLSPMAASPSIENYLLTMLTSSDYSDYWRNMGVEWVDYYDGTADIPMIHISGWYDEYLVSAIDNYTGLSSRKKGPVRLMIGPWTHGGNTESHAGEVEFGPSAAIPDFARQWHLDWFARFLRGESNHVATESPVKVFVMGTGDGHKDSNGRLFHGGYWVETSAWPLPATNYVKDYLRDAEIRTETPPATDPPDVYAFDPRHPVPTIGASTAASAPVFAGGAFDQRERPFTGNMQTGFFGSQPPYLPLKARADVLVYQTPPLANDMTVAGPIRLHLFASSSAVDTDFTAKLIDVYPPSADFPAGFEMNLTDGILRARYRGGAKKQHLMQPGEVYEFDIDPFPTANVFKKGHRIRLDVSSSNFPHFDVNPNTGEPLGMNRRTAIAVNTIYHDARHPSYVVLPIVKTSSH
jgi:putative CocE/NonD family hydrolase